MRCWRALASGGGRVSSAVLLILATYCGSLILFMHVQQQSTEHCVYGNFHQQLIQLIQLSQKVLPGLFHC